MKQDFVKRWHRKKTWWQLGIALYDWALPVHLEVILRPNSSEQLQVIVTVFCFYLGFTLEAGPDLADRMVEALKT
jgi:hypothetical protein